MEPKALNDQVVDMLDTTLCRGLGLFIVESLECIDGIQ